MRNKGEILGEILWVDVSEDEVGWREVVFGRFDLGHVHQRGELYFLPRAMKPLRVTNLTLKSDRKNTNRVNKRGSKSTQLISLKRRRGKRVLSKNKSFRGFFNRFLEER